MQLLDESLSLLRIHSKHFSLGRMTFSNILFEQLPHLLSMAKGGRSRALQTDLTPTNRVFGKMNFFS
jgi:nitrate reductase gamma subunit